MVDLTIRLLCVLMCALTVAPVFGQERRAPSDAGVVFNSPEQSRQKSLQFYNRTVKDPDAVDVFKLRPVFGSTGTPVAVPTAPPQRSPQQSFQQTAHHAAVLPSSKPRSTKYRLKPGDRIHVSVWGENMDKELVLQPDGRISYTLVGEIRAAGLTFGQLRKTIEFRLKEYIIDPKVTIIARSFEGNFVSIIGAVQKPGRHVIGNTDRLLDVLTLAGGVRFSDNDVDGTQEVANLRNAYLARDGKIVPVDFVALLNEGDMRYNVPLEIGDYIFVPSANNAPVYITGEVGTQKSIAHRGSLNLVQAITAAGGVSLDGNKARVHIIRGSLANPIVAEVDYRKIQNGRAGNFDLQPGDIIYVPPTFLTRVGRITDKIVPILSFITQTDAASRAARNSSF